MISSSDRRWRRLGFLDVRTPIMFKPTPEGARDFVVPVRLQQRAGSSRFRRVPQIFKQLTHDRRASIATTRSRPAGGTRICAPTAFEFRQLDLELAFVGPRGRARRARADRSSTRSAGSSARERRRPFPRMTYAEATRRYGTDKPDLRYGLEIQDATEATRGSEFGVFATPRPCASSSSPRTFSRTRAQRLEEVAKEWGAKGLAYLVHDEESTRSARRSRSSSRTPSSRHSACEPGRLAALLRGRRGRRRRACSAAFALHLGRELGLTYDEDSLPLGDRLPASSSGTKREPALDAAASPLHARRPPVARASRRPTPEAR